MPISHDFFGNSREINDLPERGLCRLAEFTVSPFTFGRESCDDRQSRWCMLDEGEDA
jgi:hypothetical protein